MEWHAADGTVMTQSEWSAAEQLAANGEPAPADAQPETAADGAVATAETVVAVAEAEDAEAAEAGDATASVAPSEPARRVARRVTSMCQPQRTCVGCRTTRPQVALVRVASRPTVGPFSAGPRPVVAHGCAATVHNRPGRA